MAWFGRVSVSKRGGATALIVATSAGLVISQQVGSTSQAAAATSAITVKAPASATAGAQTPIPISATVTGTSPITGTVTFLLDGAAVGAPRKGSGAGKTACTNRCGYSASLSGLAAGSHTISATFNGDAQNSASTVAQPATIVVGQAGTGAGTMTLAASPAAPQGGAPVTIKATLTGTPGLPNPTGSVLFKNGATPAGRQLVNGTASWTVASLPVGTSTITAAYSGDSNYAAQTQSLSVVVTASANDKFLQHLYTDMIGGVDPSGEAYWASQLVKGVTRPAVAFAFTQTVAYDSAVVNQLYVNIMQRPADSGGLGYWTGKMHAGMTPERIAASMVASDERFAAPSFGNSNPDTFIRATYQALLGRDWDAPGAAYWHNFLASGGPRWQLTLDFVSSIEWSQVTVRTMYAKFHLGTPDGDANTGALGYWSHQILGGMRDDQLAAQLTGSQQYFDWSQAN
jgi:hypothetical protein